MTAQLKTLTPVEVAERLNANRAVLIDIREADEFARQHARGAISRPLSAFDEAHLALAPDKDVVFTCRSGMRTAANCQRLGARIQGPSYVLEGGLDAWSAAGLPVTAVKGAPLELMRQVQIAIGLLVVVSVALGAFVNPAFLGVSAFIGAGLVMAGLSGFCGMARLLALAPWNRRTA
ncbi:MAG TPA: rhodanese family protein [Caulobacteraceae bacterium]|nr:rhodanese family protein [Caulobacteraceae bacterium]